MEITAVKIKKEADINVIIGQTHFIKTVEDMYEVLTGSVPGIKFGLAFCEASGACLVRAEGTDDELKKLAVENALNIGAGHIFVVFLKGAYPINILNALKNLSEVCSIFCATANEVEIIVAQSQLGKGILGVIDGVSPKGVEKETDIKWRKDLLRKIGYKL
ncbi:MAG: adenosine-specific kinase [Candidatus Omnitrophica bacterium]|nr:adenosine-specific kinase [Candidatus Omnitrophota bacterium]MDD5351766.1 adenosine-specific kinase [Candidatus Omnitrophota bacterium]MDD5550977.1 adenosine-specific kinase [Candidatus Omnitrophota bacterium]